MQLLLEATETAELRARCATALLDGMPPVMWYVRRQMRRERGLGISVPQYRLLALMGRMGSATLSALSEHLGASLPTTSRMVTALVPKGLIARREDPKDRRQVTLVLTPAGRALVKRARAVVVNLVAGRVASLSPAEQEMIVRAMELVQTAFDSTAAAPPPGTVAAAPMPG
jgi:DNA-binding MarR family transcriptional regulator